MMELLKTIEKQLTKLLKNLPALPKNSKEKLVVAMPWVAIVFGVLEAMLVLGLLDFLRQYREFEQFLLMYGVEDSIGLDSLEKIFIYIGIAILFISAVLCVMAYKPLQARRLSGWYLLFLSAIINLVYAFLSLFMQGQGFWSFAVSMLQSGFGIYLLLQVREFYNSETKKSK